jgi:glucose/arabinose dehydrogenase
MRIISGFCVVFVCLTLFGAPLLMAQSATRLASAIVASGFDRPVFVTAPPGDTNRLFVLEQHTGRIRIVNLPSGTVETTAFLTVTGVTTANEQGLLGLAFHPHYSNNGYFYVNYTTAGGGQGGRTEITRFQTQGDPMTAQTADPGSKTVLLTYDQPAANHNAGWLDFGPDGYLYISSGDGGGGDDRFGPIGNGQNRNTLLGKILRIDVEQEPYGIPEDNPFVGQPNMRGEIWAFGLRNPWRCSFDGLTGDLWIADVGQNAREEININPAGVGGLNFGWRPREGFIQNPAYPNETPVTPATDPVYDYGRGQGISVTGGYVYRGQAIPDLQGHYIFADYGSSPFWSFRYDGEAVQDFRVRTAELNAGIPRPIRNVSSFGEDALGEVYICDLSGGAIHKIVAEAPPPIIVSEAAVENGTFQFQFSAVPGQVYLIQRRDSFNAGDWLSFTNATAAPNATSVVVSDAVDGEQRFYRVVLDD